MNKIKFLRISWLLIIIVACRDKNQEAISYLTGSGSKNWDCITDVPGDCFSHYACGFGFTLRNNGKLQYYRYKSGKRKYSNYDGDVQYPNKWDYFSDTLVLGEKFKVIKLTQDTLIYIRGEEKIQFIQSRYK